MRFTTTIALVLVLAGVFLLIFFFGDPPDDGPKPPEPLCPGAIFNSIDRFELGMYAGQRAVLERDGPVWKVMEPFQDEARVEVVHQLLAALEANARIEVAGPGEEKDMASKGLDPPERFIVFRDARGMHRVDIGIRDPLGDEVFAMVAPSQALYRTGANILNVLDMNPQDLRDARLFRIEPMIVDEVRLEGPDRQILWAAKQMGEWKILGPLEDDADGSAIINLVNNLARIRVRSVYAPAPTAEDLAACGFGSDEYRLVLKSDRLEREVVLVPEVMGPAGAIFCRRGGEGAILTMGRDDFLRLVLDVDAYRSRALLPRVREDIRSVAVMRGEEQWFLLVRDQGQTYNIKAPFEAPADTVVDGDATPVSLYLSTLFSLQADDFVANDASDLALFGLETPEWIVIVQWQRGAAARRAELRIGAAEGGYRRVATNLKPRFIYSIKAADAAFLAEDPLLLRDRRVFNRDLLFIEKAEFRYEQRGATIARTGIGATFENDPNNRFQEFMHALNRELVVAYEPGASGPDDPRFAEPWGSVCYSIATIDGGVEEVLFEFGAKSAKGYFGRASTIERGVFVLRGDFYLRFANLFEGL